MIDTDGDGVGDMAFGDLMDEVESVLSDPDASKKQMNHARDLAKSVNEHDKENPDCETGTGSGSKDDTNSKGDTGSKKDTKPRTKVVKRRASPRL